MSALALSLGVAGAALAQDTDPYPTSEQLAKQNDLDTDLTPVAKETDLWTLVDGAEYPETEVIEGSVTTFDTDLFAVSFRNRTIGLAGGSACAAEPLQEPGEADGAFGARVAACRGIDGDSVPRVPVLYRYDEPPDDDPGWDPLPLPLPGGTEAGYIGGVAWATSDTALIVGGAGTYPRREGEPTDLPSSDPGRPDEAGKARAWLYHRDTDEVEELDLSAFTPDTDSRAGMRGFTAVDCYRDPTPGRHYVSPNFVPDPKPDIEFCLAGGLGQMWEWKAGEFTGERVDAQSPPSKLDSANPPGSLQWELDQPELFRFRVRDITFRTESLPQFGSDDPPIVSAVTAGCCARSDDQNFARRLDYSYNQDHWTSARLRDFPEAPDSAYSLTLTESGGSSLILSEGRREERGERPSLIASGGRSGFNWTFGVSFYLPGVTTNAVRTPLSTARLVEGDGDVAGMDGNRPSGIGNGSAPGARDGIPDWAVGELRSTRAPGLGARGLIVGTALPPRAQDSINEGRGTAPPSAEEVVEGEYIPFDQEKLEAHIRSRHYLLPSYSANAIDIVGDQEDGWAVGDHGAILRLSANAVAASEAAAEPSPPRLGAPRPDPLADRGPYVDRSPAIPGVAGAVPPLGREVDPLSERRMVSHGDLEGTPSAIVMSRDGSEGWAIGNDSRGGTLDYFDGARWSDCDPLGGEGIQPNPACASVAPIRGWMEDGVDRTITFRAAARVPLEHDDDPTNDDELEIVAFGGGYRGPETDGKQVSTTMFRLSDGRWRFEDPSHLTGIPILVESAAFTSPDDGWIVAHDPSRPTLTRLYRFDRSGFGGTSWIDCVAHPPRCGNGGRVEDIRDNATGGLALAGERVYLYGSRRAQAPCNFGQCQAGHVPLILYKDPGAEWTDGSGPSGDRAGFDPAFANPATEQAGHIDSLTVNQLPDGGFEGWAAGWFGRGGSASVAGVPPADAALMRLVPGNGWRRFRSPGPVDDYLLDRLNNKPPRTNPALHVAYSSTTEPDGVFLGQETNNTGWDGNRLFAYDASRERFNLVDSGVQATNGFLSSGEREIPRSPISAMALDGRGGFWVARGSRMLHHTDRAPRAVFTESPHPLGVDGTELRDLSGGPDGSVWLATDSNRVYRYDRLTGWEEARVPGWDPGRVATLSTPANAIAIGPSGEGVLVGEGGRIANVSPAAAVLDPAAGHSCALGEPPPCSTSRDLNAVDVAPDGSAITGGNRLSLLWRRAGGEFHAVTKPAIASSTAITSVSYPSPARAYIGTDAGVIFRGEMSAAGEWRWLRDNVGPGGEISTVDGSGAPTSFREIAIDSTGHGYAVGPVSYERLPSGEWRRLPDHVRGTAIDLSPTGSHALIGAGGGEILTGAGREFALARHADIDGPSGPAVGVAYLAGSTEGSVDAWVGIGPNGPTVGDSRLLRYRSDPDDPSLAPEGRVEALADAPARTPGELAIASFGKSDCARPDVTFCPEMSATTTTNEVIVERTIDELADRREAGSLDLAVMSGDATDAAGLPAGSLADLDRVEGTNTIAVDVPSASLAGQLKHRRYRELVAEELADRGVPFFAAIGSQDLSETFVCNADHGCESTKRFAPAGENLSWREAFADQAAPWGDGEGVLPPEGELSFEPAPDSDDNSLRVEDQAVDADGDGAIPDARAAIGGAATHYALDAVRDGEPVARVVFVDTSLGALAANDPLQQPHELGGGQLRFLERMICREGDATTAAIDECTRRPGQKAIVVSNTPTYSYGPGALSHTAKDANVFEALMLKHRVDLVISGALGYNGLYYTLAPGIHDPCPGGSYPETPPSGETPDCLSPAAGPTEAASENAPAEVPDPASLITEQGLAGAVPTLIASGAGGKFGPDGGEPASGPDGSWHGYSVARLMPGGNLVVEQRPILDWVGIGASDHVVEPNSRLRLRGYGRSPLSTGSPFRALHYEISNAAITHRYDLLLADPETPWLPCEAADAACVGLYERLAGTRSLGSATASGSGSARDDMGGASASSHMSSRAEASRSDAAAEGSRPGTSCEPYLCLPDRIATIDDQSGAVRAGSGKYPDTFALAMLSVDEKVATWPLVFKRSPSFVVEPASLSAPIPASPTAAPNPPKPPAPPNPPQPQIPQVNVPEVPALPGVPPLGAAAVPEPRPPAPPVPPPSTEQPSPLSLTLAPPGIAIATPTAVIQPPTPPVNPAPPGGARREARQRQAAAQKSGADNAEEGSDGQQADLGNSPPSAHGSSNMTRHALDPQLGRSETRALERRRPEPSITTLAYAGESSAGAQALLYTGGLTLFAAALALGWQGVRPTPKRRSPDAPAPAYARWRRKL